jgi:hypothetical protein
VNPQADQTLKDTLKLRSHEREEELLAMFNEAAPDVTDEDLEERELLLAAFSGGPGD